MKLREVLEIIEGEAVTATGGLEIEVRMGGGSDLMSDVLAFCEPGALLLTGLTNPQVIRTAEVAEISAVCFVRGKRPTPEMIALADSKGIALIVTRFTMFESCGRLYARGLQARPVDA